MEKLLSHVAHKISDRQQLLVAFSGGLDSTVLLHLLITLRNSAQQILSVRAIHIHHGLSHFADDWAHHCKQCCEQWQVPLEIIHVQPDKRQGGVEAAARAARYQALGQKLRHNETLLTAQHLDDQCETLLLALKRGSGPAGLSSMPQCMAFSNGELLRPLLDVPRHQLECYARQQQLCWVEDDSNQDERFERNFLRHQVLSPIQKRWPGFSTAVARSASLCAEQEQLLDELLQESLQALTDDDHSLCIVGLLSMTDARRAALLRRWIASYGVTLPCRKQLQLLWTEVALCREDAEPQLRSGNWQVRRYRQRLYLLPLLPSLQTCVLLWDITKPLLLPDRLGKLYFGEDGMLVRAPEKNEPVSIRFTIKGKVRIAGRHGTRQLKKLWQELAIPPWQRNRMPLLFYGEQLIAVPNAFVTEEGQVQTQGLKLSWSKT